MSASETKAIPNWLKRDLNLSDLEKVTQAITKAEAKTGAEIVPMVVRSSAVLHHVPVILGQFLILIGILAGLSEYAHLHFSHPLVWLTGVLVLIAILTLILSRLRWIQRALTSRYDLALQVHRRAQLEFYQSHIQETHDSTGVLIFVSMLEKQAVVLADPKISNQNDPVWQEVVDLCVKGVQHHSLTKGLCDAISRVGDILKERHPAQPHQANELPNTLTIKE